MIRPINRSAKLNSYYAGADLGSATAGGKIPLHRSNVMSHENGDYILKKPWSGEEVHYPDADPGIYDRQEFGFKG